MSLIKNNESAFELLIITIFLIFSLVAVFAWIHNGEISLISLLTNPKDTKQEASAYIDAIGSIAIGFAGAWVAIKIAKVATTLQQEDSRKKTKEIYQKEADRVSTLNSELTINVLEAKRTCTSFISFLQSNEKVLLSEKEREKFQEKLKLYNGHEEYKFDKADDLLVAFYDRLESDLLKLIKSIEEVAMDKTYVSIACPPVKCEKVSTSMIGEYFLSDSTKRKNICKNLNDIIIKDSERYDFFKEYMDTQNNFGDGLHFIRSHTLILDRKEYLSKLLLEIKNNDNEEAGEGFTPSHAAWLLLGSLIAGTKVGKSLTNNTGFLFIALMLGSQIDDDLFFTYLDKLGKKGVDKTDSNMDTKLAKEISDSVFFIHGEDQDQGEAAKILVELSVILKRTSDDLYHLLQIPGKNHGNSGGEKISDTHVSTDKTKHNRSSEGSGKDMYNN
ncbi:hypothetical protein Q4557_05130 [Shewanella sp. 5_MG-2023]|uniref:hypothetical protein n=1 Tax=Shewanella sp. 5_MG-2023 TaxID=3062656 RepID=UPI0026E41ED1|nr:hypothetical protein [Shewanella sp. 5_MG-2023]MDO6639342.1 hypothetical protein [Shewanella sp. 5_MG-2023]